MSIIKKYQYLTHTKLCHCCEERELVGSEEGICDSCESKLVKELDSKLARAKVSP